MDGEAVASAPRVGVALEVLVRDSRGAPLPGVQVTLHPFPRSDASQDFPFSSAIAPAEPPAALAAATTGASGRVRLDHLEPGERVLGAAAGESLAIDRALEVDDEPVAFRGGISPIGAAPYHGRRVAVIEGAAGEWLELIEGEAP